MAEDEATTTAPAEPAPESPGAAPPSAPPRRAAFRRRDELGLLLLALVFTGFVWAIARQSVVETRPPIENVKVIYQRATDDAAGGNLDVVFNETDPRVSVVLTCSEPEYATWKQKLQADGLVFRVGTLDAETPDRAIDAGAGDHYLLPFDETLLAGRSIPLPGGKVLRVERAIVPVKKPALPQKQLDERGIRAEILKVFPATFQLEQVRANLFSGTSGITPDPITIDQLRLDEDIGAERQVIASFERWINAKDESGRVDSARKAASDGFPTVTITVRITGGAERKIKNRWVWGLSTDDLDSWSFDVLSAGNAVISAGFLEHTLTGTAAQLDALAGDRLGEWTWQIQLFVDRAQFPGPGQDPAKLTGTLLWVPKDPQDPAWAGVQVGDAGTIEVRVSRRDG